ncbi:hypothetical protein [Halomonas sp.]|uniref:hypothetical protein n=1 Tax=Halomonas sp. TaxID=1486246 RepID=UPI00356AA561
MARERLNHWASQIYFNPTKVLEEAARLGFRHVIGGRCRLPPEIARPDRKRLIEDLDAAAFAHGLRVLIPDRDICIAELEAQDHDFVLRFGPPDDPGYCPLQLKVLVSKEVNESQTMDDLLENLNHYADAADLVVAIKIDRLGVDPRGLQIPPLELAEIWFFGPSLEGSNMWYLYGDCLGSPLWLEFQLPEG